MSKDQLIWAVFVSVLCPLFLRSPSDPLMLTVAQICGCWGGVALADYFERRARRLV